MFEHICFRNVWSSRDRVQLPPLPQQPPPPQLALPAPQRTPARGQVRSHLEPRWSWPPNWALQFPSSKTKTSNSHLLPGSSRDRPTTVQVSQSRMRRIWIIFSPSEHTVHTYIEWLSVVCLLIQHILLRDRLTKIIITKDLFLVFPFLFFHFSCLLNP